MHKIDNFSVVVPAGTYILGDPCYSVPDADWGILLDSCEFFNLPVGTVGRFNVLAFCTDYGDGEYEGSDGILYSVDSGLIGLVPVEYATLKYPDMARVIAFAENTICQVDRGILYFGDVVIDTRPCDVIN